MKLRFQIGFVLLAVTSAFAAGPRPTRTAYDVTLKNGFTIHHLRHEVTGPTTRLYIDENNFVDVASSEILEMTETQEAVPSAPEMLNSKADLQGAVTAASNKHQIDADLINSVIHAESSFNPKAISPKGAQGLMQLMPSTASRLGVTDAFDPSANVDAGTQYLRELLVRYNGDMAKALAAYNAGPLRVQQYKGVPPYRETRNYVAHVITEFNRKKLAQRSASHSAAAKSASPTAASKSR